MDLTPLANLGEFIGGVAVLATLVYLAVQVRQNTSFQRQVAEVAKADSLQEAADNWSRWRRMVADDGLSEVWFKAQSGDELSPVERLQTRKPLALST